MTDQETSQPANFGIHAMIQNPETNEVKILTAKSKKTLLKEINEYPTWSILFAVKGKKLGFKECKSIVFE